MSPKCRACILLASNPKCDAEKQKGRGVPIAEIQRQYPAISYKTWKTHFNKRHRVNKQKEAKIITDLLWGAIDMQKRIEKIYADCQDNAKKAKGKAETSRDFRDASGCWDAATKALSILKTEEKPTINNNINLSTLSDADLDARITELAKGTVAESIIRKT